MPAVAKRVIGLHCKELRHSQVDFVFCGRHCEQRESNSNPGNFRALVNLRIDAGDLILADHFKTCARNAQYISPQIH